MPDQKDELALTGPGGFSFKALGTNVVPLLTLLMVTVMLYGGYQHETQAAERNNSQLAVMKEQISATKEQTRALQENNCMNRLTTEQKRDRQLVRICEDIGEGPMITLQAYFMGRDATHPEELTDEIRANAQVTVDKANELLVRAGRSDIHTVNSGWRPKTINENTANAANSSRHLTGQAVDLPDRDRNLATWCADNLDIARELGIYYEDFRWTPTWVHLQIVPPKSGKLVYIPSTAPAKDPDFPVTWA